LKGADAMPIRRSPNGVRHVRPQPGRDRPEWVVAINRNAWSQSVGTGGRNHPVRSGIFIERREPDVKVDSSLIQERPEMVDKIEANLLFVSADVVPLNLASRPSTYFDEFVPQGLCAAFVNDKASNTHEGVVREGRFIAKVVPVL
jgi:hypothetical protein